MSTINKSLAQELIKGNGKRKKGTAGYCLVRYQNRTKYDLPGVDLYNPDAEVNCFDYAIFSSRKKFEKFMESDTVGGVDVLWASNKCKEDEEIRVSTEELLEMADLVDETETEVTRPSRRERR